MDHPPENNPGEPLPCREHLTEPEHSSSHPTGADGCTSIPLLVPHRALQRTAEETWLQNSPSFAAGEGCSPAVCYGCTASTEGHNETVSKTLLSKGRGGGAREGGRGCCLPLSANRRSGKHCFLKAFPCTIGMCFYMTFPPGTHYHNLGISHFLSLSSFSMGKKKSKLLQEVFPREPSVRGVNNTEL